MAIGRYRGHEIECFDSEWVYRDTHEIVSDVPERPCIHCGKKSTKEGYDGCIGKLPGVLNACCGHGIIKDAYIHFESGNVIRGYEAVRYMRSRR